MVKVTKSSGSSFHGHRMRASRNASISKPSAPTPVPAAPVPTTVTPAATASPAKSTKSYTRRVAGRVKAKRTPAVTKVKLPNPGYSGYQQASSGGSFSGSASTVFILLITLLILISWKQVGSKFTSIAWDPNASNTLIGSLDWKPILGASVFIALAIMIANSSPEAGGFIVLFSMGLIMVYIVENNGGAFTSLFNFLSPSTAQTPVPANTSGGSGGPGVLQIVQSQSGSQTIIPLNNIVNPVQTGHA